MKGIVLAGGSGTRLWPVTSSVSKQLLPVYDKPMIYYPLAVYLQAGIRDILIITKPDEQKLFEKVLGDGSNYGAKITYASQAKPNGLAEAFLIGEKFLDGSAVSLILGDNIFYGEGLGEKCGRAIKNAEYEGSATIFAFEVSDPQRYGVVSFDQQGAAQHIEEKPTSPPSSWAVTGLYFYDGAVVSLAKNLRPSARGELEITDLNRIYLEKRKLCVERLDQGFAWLDTGTFESLHEASSFVRTIELRQGIKIACLEEIALKCGYLSVRQVELAANAMGKNEYSSYLLRRVVEARNVQRPIGKA